ncbi:alpha/beta fold hydrolase [Nonomuraea sp. NPDC050451]|uniref:alpha/beta fold hydrolase n=1 Tax=Nonomuraea sp. NPDC050451 TaxID=3364364 RepID=UPI0037BA17D0
MDLPGQPGLSDPHRPRRGRSVWYGRKLDEVLTVADLDRAVLVGNSLGAAVALAADSPRIAARALVSPAGFVRLTVDPGTGGGFGPVADASRPADLLRHGRPDHPGSPRRCGVTGSRGRRSAHRLNHITELQHRAPLLRHIGADGARASPRRGGPPPGNCRPRRQTAWADRMPPI